MFPWQPNIDRYIYHIISILRYCAKVIISHCTRQLNYSRIHYNRFHLSPLKNQIISLSFTSQTIGRLETSAFIISLQWPIYLINSVNTVFPKTPFSRTVCGLHFAPHNVFSIRFLYLHFKICNLYFN